MKQKIYDVVIVGGGPAGSSCAIHLAKSGYQVAVVDKDIFPRDKICGDGLTTYVLYELNQLGADIKNDFINRDFYNPSKGLRIFSPGGYEVFVYDIVKNQYNNNLFFICRRKDFDYFLWDRLGKFDNISTFESYKVIDVKTTNREVKVSSGKDSITAKVLVGADGANSIVKRKIFNTGHDWHSTMLTAQAYYKNLNLINKDVIEAHMIKDLLPGGFWIFPMQNNVANVGFGMMLEDYHKNNMNLKKLFSEIIFNNPILNKKFEKSEIFSNINIRILPLVNKLKNISADRVLLTGDAIPVVHRITGEGIGEAMNSGRIAAKVIDRCLIHDNFSREYMGSYDLDIRKKFGKMVKMSKGLQKVFSSSFMLDRICKNISSKPKLQMQLESIAKDPSNYYKLFNPYLYYRMLL